MVFNPLYYFVTNQNYLSMKTKNIIFTFLISAITTIAVIFGYNAYQQNHNNPNFQSNGIPSNYKYAGLYDSNGNPSPFPGDFTQASEAGIPTVVHIKTTTKPQQTNNNLPRKNPFADIFGDDMFDQFFGQGGGGRQPAVPQMASGSGVIISQDGYIVTNNHVVAGADEVNVTLSDRKSYTAKVIGADPSYDLAVIKVEAKGLPFMLYGNSSDVKIGQWVLAIGYPLNLDATVTAGIISAKSRSLKLNRDKDGNTAGAVDSYLQTDAAVNMGNSGGALINTNGEMIGINSAIASRSGYYQGYSYAIPVNIVKKVVNDLIKYGSVQRGYIGAMFVDPGEMTAKEKEANNIPLTADGLYITDLDKSGAAFKAGMKPGDIIRQLNGKEVHSSSELQELISNYKPGDKIDVTYDRNGTEKTVQVTLKNSAGDYDIVKKAELMEKLGADLVTLDPKTARELKLSGGVVVKKIGSGVLNDQTRMRDGFIITQANGKPVKNIDELKAIIGNNSEVTIQGVYPGYNEPFEYPLILK